MTTITHPHTIDTAPADGFAAAYDRLVDARLEYEMLKGRAAPNGAVIEARAALHRARADMAFHRNMRGIC